MAVDPPLVDEPPPPLQPGGPFAAGVLVAEQKQRRWEAALKRQLWPGTFVRPCKTLDDVRQQLQLRPGSVVVIDLMAGGNVAGVLAHLAEVRLAAGVVGIAPLLSIEAESALREIGITSLLVEPVSEETLAKECLRILEMDQGPGARGQGEEASNPKSNPGAPGQNPKSPTPP